MMKTLSIVGLTALACAGTLSAATPESSKAFEKWTDPVSGVVSYRMKPGLFAETQQSLYFVTKCMTSDGRHLLFYRCANEFPEGPCKSPRKVTRKLSVYDFEKDELLELPPEAEEGGLYIDNDAGRFWIVSKERWAIYRFDLNERPVKAVKECDLPESFRAYAHLATHPTLTQNRRKVFFDLIVGNDGGKDRDRTCSEGLLDMDTGKYTEWTRAPFLCNHGQLNPKDDTVAMCAWESNWPKDSWGYEFQKLTGYNSRMWHMHADGRMVFVPPLRCPDQTTHETWSADGTYHYWCSKPWGVWYQDYRSGNQFQLSPYYAEHPNVTLDRKYVTYDQKPLGWWRGSPQRVGFYNTVTKRNVWIYSPGSALCGSVMGRDNAGANGVQSNIHPDAHPHFVANDRYVVSSYVRANGTIDLLVTPVEELVRLTAADRPDNERFFRAWPAEKDPVKVGCRLVSRFLEKKPREWTAMHNRKMSETQLTYPTVCTWFGAAEFLSSCHDRFAVRKYHGPIKEGLWKEFEGPNAPLAPIDHVDNSMFGCLPLTMYLCNGSLKAREMGLRYADGQWRKPLPTDEKINGMFDYEERLRLWNEGYTAQTRLWMDDMFMITILQLQAYKVTEDRKYADRASKEMVLYLDKLQLRDGEHAGLFHHGPGAPYIWGRGNGWMAAGMAMLMKNLPPDDVHLPRILAGYRKMMAALLKYQRADGMWGQLVDEKEGIWAETSGTAMFAYAFIEGVKRGWLDAETYGPAARRAFLAMCDYIEANGDVRSVCCGTNVGTNREHYSQRNKWCRLGDLHGQAPYLWCCAALADSILPKYASER